MNFLSFLGIKKKNKSEPSPYPYDGIMHLWEDDYLMVELLHKDNWDFTLKEVDRTNDFAKEHFDGTGFTDITVIADKPFKTIERLIDISGVVEIMVQAGLIRLQKIYMQGVGFLEGDKVPLGFGTEDFAVMCDVKGKLMQNIWLTGRPGNEEDKQKLFNAISLFTAAYNFIGVNWYQAQYYNLAERKELEAFIENI